MEKLSNLQNDPKQPKMIITRTRQSRIRLSASYRTEKDRLLTHTKNKLVHKFLLGGRKHIKTGAHNKLQNSSFYAYSHKKLETLAPSTNLIMLIFSPIEIRVQPNLNKQGTQSHQLIKIIASMHQE